LALFVLMVVGLVVTQTWLDWRETKKGWIVPDWAKGTALAGVLAVSLTAASSFASAWIQDPANQIDSDFGISRFWPELAFLFCVLGIIIFTVRRKNLRLMFLLTGVIVAAFWLGMALS
jgi:hypothetical protein